MSNASVQTGSSLKSRATSATGLSNGAVGWLSLLWLLWGVCLFGGMFWGWLDPEGPDQVGLVSRLGSSLLLVAAGWSWLVICRDSAAARFAGLIAIGMTLGTVGDFFNAGVLESIVPLPNPVLGGIAAFGLGHIAYIAACLLARKQTFLTSRTHLWASVAAWQAVGLVGWLIVVYPSDVEGAQALIWPALPYSLLLAGTAGFATALAVQDRRFTLLAVGAGLFLLSDLILAWRLFRGPFPYGGEAVWLTYGPGQMLIVYSIGSAARAIIGPQPERAADHAA